MTGEISLQGLVLPVGGIKEKVMLRHKLKLEDQDQYQIINIINIISMLSILR